MKAVVALLGLLLAPLVTPGTHAEAAPPGDDEVVAFVVRGVGNGHGRGLSQWGAYGRALAGQSYEQILGAYYGGTEPGSVDPNYSLRVQLRGFRQAPEITVISHGAAVRWQGVDYASVNVKDVGSNLFEVWTSELVGCRNAQIPDGPLSNGDIDPPGVHEVRDLQSYLTGAGFDPNGIDGWFGNDTKSAVVSFQQQFGLPSDGIWNDDDASKARSLVGSVTWTLRGPPVAGPITLTTAAPSPELDPELTLGLCQSSASIVHYRGALTLLETPDGNQVVNTLALDDYLGGVLPKEVPPSWGDGLGIEALKAQAVAARSYAMSQHRAAYADTCDTTSCQVYGGAAIRATANAAPVDVEDPRTETAIVATVGGVRVWPATPPEQPVIVSTEFSASNGPSTAGGSFPVVDDHLFDDQPGNPNHRWTRIIDADAIVAKFGVLYGLTNASGVRTAPDADSIYNEDWANEVVLGNGKTVSAWDFRNAFGLPSPGFELIPVRRQLTAAGDFALIGDSVGVGIVDCCGSNLKVLTEGVFSSASFDALVGRRTAQGGSTDGVHAAQQVALGTDLVVVELGYNDTPLAMTSRIDAVMTELRARQVGLVAWVNVSERKTSTGYAATNSAISAAASHWSEMIVFDWKSASDDASANRWFSSDGVHLTTTGNAEFALWLRGQIVTVLADGYTPPEPPRRLAAGVPLRIPVLGHEGVPESGVVGVALNVTAVNPSGPGWVRVWPCGSPEPVTSSVNYAFAGAVEPNAVVVPVDSTGAVCVVSKESTDLVVDVSAWFDSGVGSAMGRIVDTRYGVGPIPPG